MRWELAVLHGLGRLWIPHSGLIDIDSEAGHHERYDNRHHGAGPFVRRLIGMVEFLQICHCLPPRVIYGVSIVNCSTRAALAISASRFIARFGAAG
jgi:hypothetical protein